MLLAHPRILQPPCFRILINRADAFLGSDRDGGMRDASRERTRPDFEVGRARLNVLANVFSNYAILCSTVNSPYSELESSQQGRNLT